MDEIEIPSIFLFVEFMCFEIDLHWREALFSPGIDWYRFRLWFLFNFRGSLCVACCLLGEVKIFWLMVSRFFAVHHL